MVVRCAGTLFLFPCLVCLESCFTAVVGRSSLSHAYTKYLSRMSPGSLFLCVPYTMSATRWETEGYPHTHTYANRMQRLMDGDRREPHAQ